MFHSIVLKFKSTISSLFGSGKNKRKTVGQVDKDKDPLRYSFELAALCSFYGSPCLAKDDNGEYLDPKVKSAWWSWREVYATDYDDEAEQLTEEQHKELFQNAFLKSPYAVNHSPSELLAVNNENCYSIKWVQSAWHTWMQAVYMYKIP